MNRKLSLLFLALAVAFTSACSNLVGPNREDDGQRGGEDEECGVVVGTHTRLCDDNN